MLALLLVVTTPLVAQEDTYIVQKGDNLWRLAGSHLDDAKLWEQIYSDNPFLQEPGRRFQKNGVVYVMVRPGEKLVGLEKLGITATLPPIEQLRLEQPPAQVYRIATTPAWVWWPLALTVGILIAIWLIYRMLTRDPVNSGPAMVPGGITEANATSEMQQVAARAYGLSQRASQDYRHYQQFTVIRQTVGRIWGNMTVRYADGRSVPRRLNGERAYEAEVRFPDGRTETLYMLQGCGNDLRYDGISRYLPGPKFRFEADQSEPIQEVPTSQPAAQPVGHNPNLDPHRTSEGHVPEVVQVATPASAPTINDSGEFVRTKDAPAKEENLLKISFRPEENGKDSLVQAEGVDVERFTFEKNGNSITFRFREVKEEPVAAN